MISPVKRFTPYILLFCVACISYFPVSFMIYSLKNDIIGLEYPIKFFISDSLRNNASPLWFNTWALGFPLEGIITWSIFSPPQLLFASLFRYNLYILHLEFVFYIGLSGCSMYYLLKRHFTEDPKLTWILAVCFMLSGFMVSSSQWLLYLTAASFTPLSICLLLTLLKEPCFKNSMLFAFSCYIMITSVYVAFSLVTFYIIFFVCMYHLYKCFSNKQKRLQILSYLALGGIILTALIIPCLYYTLQVLSNIERGKAIIHHETFFNSNYLHPKSLLSLFSAFAGTRTKAFNTEDSMMNSYLGLSSLVFIPLCLWKINSEKKFQPLLLLAGSLIFLLLSFGQLTPIRSWANFLPGFSYFRNAGLFRFFFLFVLILFFASVFKKQRLTELIQIPLARRIVLIAVIFLTCLSIALISENFHASKRLTNYGSIKSVIRSISYEQTLFISGLIQLPLLFLLIYSWYKRKSKLLVVILTLDMMINTMICLPVFTISSYSVNEVERIFNSLKDYPVQNNNVTAVSTVYKSEKAVWYNVNVYKKEISLKPSYWGPLYLKFFKPSNASETNIPLLYSANRDKKIVTLLAQKPGYLASQVLVTDTATICFIQNYYPGWSAYLNQKKIHISKGKDYGMKVIVTESGKLEFKYKKPFLVTFAFSVNFLIIAITLLFLVKKLERIK